jgi:hypothetical protein
MDATVDVMKGLLQQRMRRIHHRIHSARHVATGG